MNASLEGLDISDGSGIRISISPIKSQNVCIKFNQSDPFHIGDRYGGIPLNLLTNLIGWIILLLLFFLIRKKVVRKISLGLSRDEIDGMDAVTTQWVHIFFGKDKETREDTSETGGNTESAESLYNQNKQEDDNDEAEQKHTKGSTPENNTKFLTLKEKNLVGLMGPDAVQYLRFQKYIIIYILLTTIVSLGVILPLNFQGTQLGNATDFGHTTLANLNPNDHKDSIILWIHVVIAFLMFPAAIFLMRRFSIGLKMTDMNLKITRTLAVENIPKKLCNIEDIKKHFSEAYPEYRICDIQIVYNVTKLTQLSLDLENVVDSKKYSEEYLTRHGEDLKMIPVGGARCCKCFCLPCQQKVSCIEYFTQEEVKLRNLKLKEKEKALKNPLGMAFITFQNINHARQVLRDHKNSILSFKRTSPESKLAMEAHNWRVWYAPLPNDIIWENLSNKRNWTLVKKIIANLFIFIVAFFLTTPQFLVHQLDPIMKALKNLTYTPSLIHLPKDNNTTNPILEQFMDLPVWMTDFLPTLLIWTFTALLPVVVAYADLLVGHWTRSGQNHAIMKKTFWYLLFMVIILPTFGFTSSQAYIDFLWKNNNLNWECIFLPDSGAFFVNYVITSAMIGSGLELIRFPELFWYLIQICASRSKADSPAIQKAIIYEFRFGEQYARMMLIFAMVVMFSISCPLITPFGCLYFILKHLVDRHNLAFVYARSKINKKVHATAINFVIMSVALLQFFMVVFSFIRSLDSDFKTINLRTKAALALFILTLNICSAQIWSNTCRRISPIKYEDVLLGDDPEDEHDQLYLPAVLKDISQMRERTIEAANQTSKLEYGTS